MHSPKVSRVAIIDFGMGNLFSVQRACEHVSLHTTITHEKSHVADADGLILPGVGAFGDAMLNLEKLDLINPIKDFIKSGRPFMGICLGMQLLMTRSEEFGIHQGLGVIEGSVVRFSNQASSDETIKVPQVGWNQIVAANGKNSDRWSDSPLKSIQSGEYMYFVHSYYVKPAAEEVVLSNTVYENAEYCSSVFWKNIFATQFHPEKSAGQGILIYKNWASTLAHS